MADDCFIVGDVRTREREAFEPGGTHHNCRKRFGDMNPADSQDYRFAWKLYTLISALEWAAGQDLVYVETGRQPLATFWDILAWLPFDMLPKWSMTLLELHRPALNVLSSIVRDGWFHTEGQSAPPVFLGGFADSLIGGAALNRTSMRRCIWYLFEMREKLDILRKTWIQRGHDFTSTCLAEWQDPTRVAELFERIGLAPTADTDLLVGKVVAKTQNRFVDTSFVSHDQLNIEIEAFYKEGYDEYKKATPRNEIPRYRFLPWGADCALPSIDQASCAEKCWS